MKKLIIFTLSCLCVFLLPVSFANHGKGQGHTSHGKGNGYGHGKASALGSRTEPFTVFIDWSKVNKNHNK